MLRRTLLVAALPVPVSVIAAPMPAQASPGDTWSIQQKTSWLKSKGLLGAMVWEMSGDTASGTLMTALHSGLSSAS